MNYLPLVSALIGGILGGVGGNFIKYILDARSERRQRLENAKILANSLRGEIKSLRDQMKTYRRATSGFLRGLPESQEKPSKDWIEGMRVDLSYFTEIEAPVYKANVGQIGILWNLLSKEVVEFYSDFAALESFTLRFIKLENAEIFTRRLKLFEKEIESLIDEATMLNKRLLQFSDRRGDYPGKRDRRRKCLVEPREPSRV